MVTLMDNQGSGYGLFWDTRPALQSAGRPNFSLGVFQPIWPRYGPVLVRCRQAREGGELSGYAGWPARDFALASFSGMT
jgi:hypothetical protein